MYILTIKSKAQDGFIATDTFKVAEQETIKDICKAYDILEEKILSFNCKYAI